LEMRPHYSNYFKGLDHFKEFRMRLVLSNNLQDILSTLQEVEHHYTELSFSE